MLLLSKAAAKFSVIYTSFISIKRKKTNKKDSLQTHDSMKQKN